MLVISLHNKHESKFFKQKYTFLFPYTRYMWLLTTIFRQPVKLNDGCTKSRVLEIKEIK